MPSNWKWKAILVAVVTVIGVYLLIPTVFRMNRIREVSEANGQSLPPYVKIFPKKTLNLGLDLRGGIYIEMEVDIDNALKRKADLFASEIESELKDKKISFESITQPEPDGKLHIRANTTSDIDEIRGVIETAFNQVFTVLETTMEKELPTIIIGFAGKYRDFLSTNVVDQALETIRNRIDRYGVAEPSITKVGATRISIELPGLSDPERAINIIKRTGQLEFKLVDDAIEQAKLTALVTKTKEENNMSDNYSMEAVNKINELLKKDVPEDSEISFELQRDPVTRRVLKGIPYLIKKKAEVTGDMLQNAMVNIYNNEPYVDLTFDKQGAKLFGDLTSNNVGKKLAIVLDGNVMKAPVIKEAITQGRAQITLGYGNYGETLKEAEDLTLVLQEGSLPATMHEATKTVVGPSLGKDSIRQGVNASLVGALAIFIFMVIYYKLSGLWANIALIVNLVLLLAVMSLFQATLTMPGIAGIVLTIGMAVDANVIINERIREELALGRTPRAAIDNGYTNAFSAIFDGNITTLITGLILYQFGTGPVKGFAVTLCIGIITTLFTAIVITRLIFDYRAIKRKTETISI